MCVSDVSCLVLAYNIDPGLLCKIQNYVAAFHGFIVEGSLSHEGEEASLDTSSTPEELLHTNL